MQSFCPLESPSFLGDSCQGGTSVGVFMSLLDLLIRTNCRIAQPCERVSTRQNNRDLSNFDFIVVGGGVAGSVVASRLSENPSWKVALLEAGPDEPTVTMIPLFWTSAVGTELDWKYETVVQKNACLSTGGICSWPRGKMLGGSSSMSGSMYTRGHRSIFDSWASEGNYGWSFDEVLPYFKKSENNKNADIVERPYHGFKGPMVVQQFSSAPAMAQDLLEAGKEIGLEVRDLNGDNQTGIAIAQIMVEDGLRASTPRMYLQPIIHRKNLFVKLNATVTRLVIDKYWRKVRGVEFYQNGRKQVVHAKKEVILSAGAIGSPHLLLLSGVGPKADLELHNIDVIHDLKVGHNLQNHVATSVYFTANSTKYESELTLKSINEYMVNQSGPMSNNGLTQMTAFTSTNDSSTVPNLQLFFDGYSSSCPEKASNTVQITIRPTNVLPSSRGYITLRSNNSSDSPLIYANYLTEEKDADVLVEGIKLVIKMSKAQALQKWNFTLDETPLENCTSFDFGSDDYWYCVVYKYTGGENHQGGTCKMGPRPCDGDVVDPELRVHGISNLRVVDASIFPRLPNSNQIASIIMTAEKGADMIQHTWGIERKLHGP